MASTASDSIDFMVLNFVTPEEVAERMGASMNHVRTLLARRDLPFFRIGGRIRLEIREVDTYIDIAKSSGLAGLARVRRAHQRRLLMLERRLPFDIRGTEQNADLYPPKEGFKAVKLPHDFSRSQLGLGEVSARLRVSVDIVRNLFHSQELPGQERKGIDILFELPVLNEYMRSVRYEVRVY